MLLGVAVGRVGRDEVANPAERAARSDPEAGRDNQPAEPRQNPAVVKLADTRNQKTQNSCQSWVTHLYTHLRAYYTRAAAKSSQQATGSGRWSVVS